MRLFSLLVLIVFVCAAAPVAADEIAVSLVHGQSRIDIPASAITRINAWAILTVFVPETKQRRDIPDPHVELCYTAEIQARICQLTREIVDQPMTILVDCEPASKAVVREPICGPCVQISANDVLEANALAQKLRTGSNRRCAPLS